MEESVFFSAKKEESFFSFVRKELKVFIFLQTAVKHLSIAEPICYVYADLFAGERSFRIYSFPYSISSAIRVNDSQIAEKKPSIIRINFGKSDKNVVIHVSRVVC